MLGEPSTQALVLCCKHVNEAVALVDNLAHRKLIATLRLQIKKLTKVITQLQAEVCESQMKLQASQHEAQLLAGALLSIHQLSDANLRNL